MNDITQRAGLDDANPVWFQAAYPFCKDIHVQAAPFPTASSSYTLTAGSRLDNVTSVALT